MKSETKKSVTQDQPARQNVPLAILKEDMAQVSSTRSMKNATLEERKKDANKPIYLVRYE
jgi:hypothetical protein